MTTARAHRGYLLCVLTVAKATRKVLTVILNDGTMSITKRKGVPMDMAKEYESHKRWVKENTVMVTMRLQKNTDADILAFLEGKKNQTVIKAALREYMKNHTEESGEK